MTGSSWQVLGQAGAHGFAQGGLAAIQGGDFWSSTATGAFSSAAGSTFGNAPPIVQIGGSALVGGFVSEGTGGSFVDGFGTGLIVSGLNHYMHKGVNKLKNQDPLSTDEWAQARKIANRYGGDPQEYYEFLLKHPVKLVNTDDIDYLKFEGIPAVPLKSMARFVNNFDSSTGTYVDQATQYGIKKGGESGIKYVLSRVLKKAIGKGFLSTQSIANQDNRALIAHDLAYRYAFDNLISNFFAQKYPGPFKQKISVYDSIKGKM